jgi:hypothetical protein
LKKLLLINLLLATPSQANELTFQFKNPSFNGNGASAHWLTVENQETSRTKAIRDKIESQLRTEALAQQNSILNRFMTNLQSRIYSQLAKQLTDNLFAESGSESGAFELDGNKIEYEKTFDSIVLRITDVDGEVTSITMPIGSFSF